MGIGLTRDEYEDEQREHQEEVAGLEADLEQLTFYWEATRNANRHITKLLGGKAVEDYLAQVEANRRTLAKRVIQECCEKICTHCWAHEEIVGTVGEKSVHENEDGAKYDCRASRLRALNVDTLLN